MSRRLYKWFGLILVVSSAIFIVTGGLAASDLCDICGQPTGAQMYTRQDKVTGEMKHMCESCSRLSTVCYLCGLPVKKDFQTLSDGRVICARDAAGVVLDGDEALRMFGEVEETLGRSMVRFMTFPEANVTFALADRVNIQNLFRFAGNDYACPDVWGYYQPDVEANGHRVSHFVSVLSGLPRSGFRITCAHELTHAWVHDNVSPERLNRLSRDSHEGFCELVAYNLACQLNDEAAKQQILSNQYTRGQVELLIAAQEKFGFNDVVDWMKYGEDDRLYAGEVERVRRVVMPSGAARVVVPPIVYPPAPPPPDHLELKGVFWSAKSPAASINGRLLALEESARVRVANSNVLVRCLSITEDEVRVLLVDSGEKQVLKFREK